MVPSIEQTPGMRRSPRVAQDISTPTNSPGKKNGETGTKTPSPTKRGRPKKTTPVSKNKSSSSTPKGRKKTVSNAENLKKSKKKMENGIGANKSSISKNEGDSGEDASPEKKRQRKL